MGTVQHVGLHDFAPCSFDSYCQATAIEEAGKSNKAAEAGGSAPKTAGGSAPKTKAGGSAPKTAAASGVAAASSDNKDDNKDNKKDSDKKKKPLQGKDTSAPSSDDLLAAIAKLAPQPAKKAKKEPELEAFEQADSVSDAEA